MAHLNIRSNEILALKKLNLKKSTNKHLSSHVIQTALDRKRNRFPQHLYIKHKIHSVANIKQNSGLREHCNFSFVARILFTVLSHVVILRSFLIFLQRKRSYVSEKGLNRLDFLMKRIVMSKLRYYIQL